VFPIGTSITPSLPDTANLADAPLRHVEPENDAGGEEKQVLFLVAGVVNGPTLRQRNRPQIRQYTRDS
jgi:hypothetical protein